MGLGPVVLLVPMILTVLGYESWYRTPVANPGEAAATRAPAPTMVPFAGFFPDGRRVWLAGTF